MSQLQGGFLPLRSCRPDVDCIIGLAEGVGRQSATGTSEISGIELPPSCSLKASFLASSAIRSNESSAADSGVCSVQVNFGSLRASVG